MKQNKTNWINKPLTRLEKIISGALIGAVITGLGIRLYIYNKTLEDNYTKKAYTELIVSYNKKENHYRPSENIRPPPGYKNIYLINADDNPNNIEQYVEMDYDLNSTGKYVKGYPEIRDSEKKFEMTETERDSLSKIFVNLKKYYETHTGTYEVKK